MQEASATVGTPDQKQVEAWMIDYITSAIDLPKDSFPAEARFDTYGLDSVELIIMAGMMEEAYRLEIEASELFENPSVALFSAHVARRLAAAG